MVIDSNTLVTGQFCQKLNHAGLTRRSGSFQKHWQIAITDRSKQIGQVHLKTIGNQEFTFIQSLDFIVSNLHVESKYIHKLIIILKSNGTQQLLILLLIQLGNDCQFWFE